MGQVAFCSHGIAGFDPSADGYVGEEDHQHVNEVAGCENADDVGLMEGGEVGFGPVNFKSPLAMVWKVAQVCVWECFLFFTKMSFYLQNCCFIHS